MATALPSYTPQSRNCQHFGDTPTPSPTRPPTPSAGQLNDRQALAKLHALGVRFVRFSKAKIAFDVRHRTWGLTLAALLRTYDDPSLLVGWIPASVLATCLDVDSGDWRRLVELYPPAYHNASGTPGRRHLIYRDTLARADINSWEANGCHGDVRSAGPVILYDARRLLAALNMGLRGGTFPPATFRAQPQQMDEDPGTKVHSQQERDTAEGNPFPPSESPGGGDIGSRYTQVPPTASESSQPQSLFDVLRYWAYAHVADTGDAEGWLEAVERQAEALVATVPDPEHYSPARVATTARSVAAWTWARRDGFTGGRRDVDAVAQAWRGRRSAEARWEAHAGRDAEIVRLSLAGYTQRVIARSVGISPMTVNRVLKRLEEAQDGGVDLRMDVPEPVADDLEIDRPPCLPVISLESQFTSKQGGRDAAASEAGPDHVAILGCPGDDDGGNAEADGRTGDHGQRRPDPAAAAGSAAECPGGTAGPEAPAEGLSHPPASGPAGRGRQPGHGPSG